MIALKFILMINCLLPKQDSYGDKESANDDPFAKGIFEIEGVFVFYMISLLLSRKTKIQAGTNSETIYKLP
jgi:hypothetical protein